MVKGPYISNKHTELVSSTHIQTLTHTQTRTQTLTHTLADGKTAYEDWYPFKPSACSY